MHQRYYLHTSAHCTRNCETWTSKVASFERSLNFNNQILEMSLSRSLLAIQSYCFWHVLFLRVLDVVFVAVVSAPNTKMHLYRTLKLSFRSLLLFVLLSSALTCTNIEHKQCNLEVNHRSGFSFFSAPFRSCFPFFFFFLREIWNRLRALRLNNISYRQNSNMPWLI